VTANCAVLHYDDSENDRVTVEHEDEFEAMMQEMVRNE
jgi:hypothetical protein